MENELGTIEQEAAECRLAFANSKIGDPVWNCHHDREHELLTEPAEDRIRFILANKPIEEQPRRLRELRPVRDLALYADYEAKVALLDADYGTKRAPLYADYEAKRAPLDASITSLHRLEYPDSKWNGVTIFES
jgi:hypothetical protein